MHSLFAFGMVRLFVLLEAVLSLGSLLDTLLVVVRNERE
jgi:hypothetical protein